MYDQYGSTTPLTLHTHTPTCAPGPQPLSTMPIEQLLNTLLPPFLFLLILPWLIIHIPPKPKEGPPSSPTVYVLCNEIAPPHTVCAWGGEKAPIFWKPECPQPTHNTPNSQEKSANETPKPHIHVD